MQFLEKIVKQNEKKLPKRPDDPEAFYINWEDYNYPQMYPIVHYNPDEVKDPKKQSFVSVT